MHETFKQNEMDEGTEYTYLLFLDVKMETTRI